MEISNVTKTDKAYEVSCNSGEVVFFIPIRGSAPDLIRTKVQVNVPKKYTTLDIHILQEKIFKTLVDTEYTEVE